MPKEPSVHLRLEVARWDGTLTGEIGVDGAPTQPFTGWIGLNAAIENLLTGAVTEPLGEPPSRRIP